MGLFSTQVTVYSGNFKISARNFKLLQACM